MLRKEITLDDDDDDDDDTEVAREPRNSVHHIPADEDEIVVKWGSDGRFLSGAGTGSIRAGKNVLGTQKKECESVGLRQAEDLLGKLPSPQIPAPVDSHGECIEKSVMNEKRVSWSDNVTGYGKLCTAGIKGKSLFACPETCEST